MSVVSSCSFRKFTISFSANIITEGGKDIVYGDFSEIWKLQRKIAFGAIRLVFDNISTCGYVLHTLIRFNGPHTTPTGFDRLSGMDGIVVCVRPHWSFLVSMQE